MRALAPAAGREPPGFDETIRRLEGHRGRRLPDWLARRRAAVAVVLGPSPRRGSAQMLFVQRAERPGDPWSGDMAFPGGLMSASDASLEHTARREAREEVGLDIEASGREVTALSDRLTLSPDRHPLVVRPIVFRLPTTPAALAPRDGEVTSAHWIDLAFFYRHAHHTTLSRRYLGIPMTFTCYRFEGHAIWGLTLRMVRELVRVVGGVCAAGPGDGRRSW